MNPKRFVGIFLVLFWLGWQLTVPEDLIGTDLGRYIKNGDLIVHGQTDVLYKNYYSYTYPQYPSYNYSWLFSVFCYIFWHIFGFNGLSFIYLLFEVFAFYLFFRCWEKSTTFAISCAFALLSFPFITFRTLIRPELFSYLFCGLFLWIVTSYRVGKIKPIHFLFILGLLQTIWVNTHIFFIFSIVIMFLLWVQAIIDGENKNSKVFQKSFLILLGCSLINPFGINIFYVIWDTWRKAILLPIRESMPVLDVLTIKYMPFESMIVWYFFASLVVLAFGYALVIRQNGFRKNFFIGALFLVLSLMAFKSFRMINLYAYFFVTFSAYIYSQLLQTESVRTRKTLETGLIFAGVIISIVGNFNQEKRHFLGIIPGANIAAEFIKDEKIEGPIFNTFNIGGYLIYNLAPQYKLFLDDRGLAAYPKNFIEETYLETQWNDNLWYELDNTYHFNVIVCSAELSYWGTDFILNRLKDHQWALVFLNPEVRIFLKRNIQNEKIIRRYLIHVPLGNAGSYYDQALEYYNKGKPELAIFNYTRAVQIDPDYPEAYYNRGLILSSMGQLNQAINDYNKAIALKPGFSQAYNNLGNLYCMMGNYKQAKVIFDKLIEQNPGFALGYYGRATVFYGIKEYQKAWVDMKKAVSLGAAVDPRFINALKISMGARIH